MAQIEFRQVCKSFGNTKVIEDCNLVLQDGKFTVLVGASGCGKTTLLRMVAGIGPATSGQVLMDGKDITDLEPGKRDVAMVFQNYAIYPTMTVRENIEFGLKNKKVPKAERDRLIKEVAESVGLVAYIDRKPGTLSGGQRQRIALARAMVKKPKVFLMDEPLSNLDAKLRVAMRVELIELHEKLKTTFVYVTHDQVEAMSMADVIVLMDKGKILQQGTPEDIYNEPDTVFIAQFIGSPPMNIMPLAEGFQLGYRPEKVTMSRTPDNSSYRRLGEIVTREMLGSETLYKVQLKDAAVMVKSLHDSYKMGDKVYIHVDIENLYYFDADGCRIRSDKAALFEKCATLAGGKNDA
jgi:sn-glycerol 3-phosphate transport system ATP-binding protein